MASIIVGVDVVFFTNRFWERLTINVGIVMVSQLSISDSGVREQGAIDIGCPSSRRIADRIIAMMTEGGRDAQR
jgi:hypothetical protein